MSVVILKFGGTSLRDLTKDNHVLSHVQRTRQEGKVPVLVVSAIGRKGEAYATDTLIQQLEQIHPSIHPKKKDLVASCGEIISTAIVSHYLESNGIPAEPLTCVEAGIITDHNFNFSNIINIDTENILRHIAQGKVPVVAGFQGVTQRGEITTLGRGGSDITAVSLGGYLKADKVEIYTDVPGVAVIDPKIVPSPHYLSSLHYDDMYTMASHGAKVIHPRAVKIGRKLNIPMEIRSTYSDMGGTLLTNVRDQGVTSLLGIAMDIRGEFTKISLLFNKDLEEASARNLEEHLRKEDATLEILWMDKRKGYIFVNTHQASYYCEKIYQYYFL